LGSVKAFEVEESKDESAYDSGGWICDGYALNFTVKPKPRLTGHPKQLGKLTVLIDLARSDSMSTQAGFPLLAVGWAPGSVGCWELEELAWPPGPEYSLWSGELVAFKRHVGTSSWRERTWLYAVPLTACHGPDDIRRLVVAPALGLLQGDEVPACFASVPERLRFTERNGRIDLVQ
jgi:hypothetical protein